MSTDFGDFDDLEDLEDRIRDEIRSELRHELRNVRRGFSPFRAVGHGVAEVMGNLISFVIISLIALSVVYFAKDNLEVGAAEFTARQLGNLNANRIEVDAGIGDIDLDFTGEWCRDARISVDMGLGTLTLRFPKGLRVKLVKDTFLTSLDSEGLIKRGDAYY